ncbi:thermonuclease family protein [Phragmitibacter flavus]|uniref:Thermonuclease family protein n=1 Tax=Phragmitibacter flavus TaxID=2576071 RepID=A0A5R8KDE5_9BACT|nr:thermonuclease family protein [Phragmitibacter flavus]
MRARVVGVHDGDSITVLAAEKVEIKVRLEGVDAPELRQDFGRVAKQALSEAVFGKTVTLVPSGRDRYRRLLARVVYRGRDVNLEMVATGMAWHYVRYSKDAKLAAAEREARLARLGLWSQRGAIPPWEWRK